MSGRVSYEDAILRTQPTEQTRLVGATALVIVGWVRSYPQHAPSPFHKEDLWDDDQEETNAALGPSEAAALGPRSGLSPSGRFQSDLLAAGQPWRSGRHLLDPRGPQMIPAYDRARRIRRERGALHRRVGTCTAPRVFPSVDDVAGAIVCGDDMRQRGADHPGHQHQIRVLQFVTVIARRTWRALRMSLARERYWFQVVRPFGTDVCRTTASCGPTRLAVG